MGFDRLDREQVRKYSEYCIINEEYHLNICSNYA